LPFVDALGAVKTVGRFLRKKIYVFCILPVGASLVIYGCPRKREGAESEQFSSKKICVFHK